MKKILSFIICLLSLICVYSFNDVVVRAEEYTVNNNADISNWTKLSGNNPSYHLKEEEIDGIFLSGSGSDKIFDFKYNKSLLQDEIMADLLIDTKNINYESEPMISFIFSTNDKIICSFDFQLLEGAYNALLTFGDYSLEYDKMQYKDDGHIQFRISKEEIMNRDTGEYHYAWNLVFGIQKKTVTVKNDKYSIKENKFDNNDFEKIDSYMEENCVGGNINAEISASSKSDCELGLILSQIGTDNFYNCYVFSNKMISFSDVTYTNLKMSYVLPENDINYTGIVIKRYCNGEYDKTYQYSNKYANGLTEKYLKQNSDYSYEIFGLEQVSSSNRIACNKIMFKYEPATIRTSAGNPLILLYGFLIVGGFIAIFILIYVYRFEISDMIKRAIKRK